MATRKSNKPKIVKGTHLTVTTDEAGHTTLVWDDEQLLKEVREAIAGVEQGISKPAAKTARAKKTKITNG